MNRDIIQHVVEDSIINFPKILCKSCNNDVFEVAQKNYMTLIRCALCGTVEVIHEG